MKTYQVYFEIYGKKLKTSVLAKNENQAKEIIKEKIVFHKITIEPTNNNDIDFYEMIETMKDVFGIKKPQ